MNHDDVFNLVDLGLKLFSDISNAAHKHQAGQSFNSSDLAVARDLVQSAQVLYKLSSSAQRSSSAVGSGWQTTDGRVMGLGYNSTTGLVVMNFVRNDGSGYNYYYGGGEVYKNYINILVSGYNSAGEYIIIRGTSREGYIMDLVYWYKDYNEIQSDRAVMQSNWA